MNENRELDNLNPQEDPKAAHKKKRAAHRTTRRQKYLLLSGATTFLIVVALVLINVLTVYITDRYPVTVDLTPQKVFQLTDQSKEYIAQLNQPVSVQVMTSEENFISGGEYYVQANEVLKEYTKYSDQITLEYVDLLQNPSLASQYEDIQIGDIVVSSGNRSQTLTAYDLFNVESGSYYGSYITSSKAEQAMTSAILNVTSETQVKAGVLTGHGEQSPDGLTSLMENNNFEIVTITPATEEIPQDVDVLIWMAPINDPDQEVLDRIDAFLSDNEDKTLLYFADTTQPELPRLQAFLEKWGIGVESSSIIETDSQHIINMNPYFSTTTILNDKLTDTMTDTSIPITMPFARPLEQVYETNMDISTEILLQSTDTTTTIPYGITEDQLQNWTPEEYGPFPLAILSTKSFEDGSTSQLLAFGSAVSLSDSLLSSGSFCNADYYLSVLNTLTHRENVISIQSKTLGGQELGLNTMQVFIIGVGFMIVLPVVVLVCGLYLWYKRRNA